MRIHNRVYLVIQSNIHAMKNATLIQHAVKTAGVLVAFAIIGTAFLAYTFDITKAPIAKSEAEAKLALFKQILPPNTYDNALLNTTINVPPNPLLGNTVTTIANIATKQSQPVGVILEAIAHDGYSGDIKLLIAIKANGEISGVRVLTHKETPGLGDYIDITRSDWITQLDQKSLLNPEKSKWRVKKDKGEFDFMAGATITPRAVIKAVYQALEYFDANKSYLFASKTSTEQAKVDYAK
jgi:Na+-translocating ferredoxin:NAD+ oxidoreductase subunit G